jgi:hypothetical protein
LAEGDRVPSANGRPESAVEVVPVLLEAASEPRAISQTTPGLFEELPGRCFLTLVAAGELLESGLLPCDHVVEAGCFRRHLGFPALLGSSFALDAALEVFC